jgi:hypothetical protein
MGTIWQEQGGADGHLSWTPADASIVIREPPLGLRLVPFGAGADGGMALMVPPRTVAVWVNGESIVAGLRVLEHRDEILCGDSRWYYSAESRAEVKTYVLPAGERRPRCGVCRSPLDDGQPAVACPQCGRLYHQIAEQAAAPAKPCWTYRPECLCGHPTALDESALWRPDKEACCG